MWCALPVWAGKQNNISRLEWSGRQRMWSRFSCLCLAGAQANKVIWTWLAERTKWTWGRHYCTSFHWHAQLIFLRTFQLDQNKIVASFISSSQRSTDHAKRISCMKKITTTRARLKMLHVVVVIMTILCVVCWPQTSSLALFFLICESWRICTHHTLRFGCQITISRFTSWALLDYTEIARSNACGSPEWWWWWWFH